MGKFKQVIEKILVESEELFEMSTLRKYQTRLPVNIWIDDQGAFRNVPHNLPRLKFQANKSDKVIGKGIPISISIKKPEILIDNPKTELNSYEIGQIKNFIVRNYKVLMKYWNQEISTEELFKMINKV